MNPATTPIIKMLAIWPPNMNHLPPLEILRLRQHANFNAALRDMRMLADCEFKVSIGMQDATLLVAIAARRPRDYRRIGSIRAKPVGLLAGHAMIFP
jgi:hypothetical protein